MKNKLIYIVVCIIIVSCKALPSDNYQRLLQQQSKNKTISEIITSNNYILLPLDVEHNDTLALTDSILQVTENGLYYSNYKLFKSKGEKGKKYKVTIYGMCDCLGLRKYIIKPTIEITDSKGKYVYAKLVKDEIITPTDQFFETLPLHNDIEWEYILPTTGLYNIVVYTNNNIVGNEYRSDALINWPVFRTNIKGEFMITIQAK